MCAGLCQCVKIQNFMLHICYCLCTQTHMHARTHAHTHTHTHTTVLRLFGFLWDNPSELVPEETFTHPHLSYTHTSTPIVIFNNSLLASSIYFELWHLLCSIYMPDSLFFHNLSPSFLWSTSWPGTLCFILHTFLHPIIFFFSQHMPIPLQPVFPYYRDCVI